AVFGAALAVAGLWWTALVLVHSGDAARAIGYGGVGLPAEVAAGMWPSFTRGRAFWVIPATTAVLSPLLGLRMFQLVGEVMHAARATSEATERERAVAAHAALGAVFVAITLVWPSKENRFLLAGYVPLAVGTGLAADAALEMARRHFGVRGGKV